MSNIVHAPILMEFNYFLINNSKSS